MSRNRIVIVVPVIVLGLAFLLLTPAAQATVYYWSTSSSTLAAGNGTWSTATGNNYWTTNSSGGALSAWSTSGTNDADFYASGTSTVTVSGAQTVGNITFDGSGYTLSGGTLNLAGGTITANQNATIGSFIGGTTALTKAGAGVLILTGADTYSGLTTISAGTLQVGSGASGGPGSINSTSGVVDDGFLAFDSSTSITSFSHNISGSGGVGQMSAGKRSASRAPTPTPARRSSTPAHSRRAVAGTGFCPARPS